ncbi:phospholipase/Carboxylesterase [Stanieria sp. NIES-3757]|nr:phospholipase/Carboxylesterase [Stanieria sp. NIES-3757]
MKVSKTLDAIALAPENGEKPTNLLVMLHGWGANLQDLAPLAQMLNLPGFEYIFPNAPFPHPQVPGGRAWYALETSEYDGLAESRTILFEWLQSLEASTGIPPEKTILAGFSQGGAMALDLGLSLPFAALCSLSGYLHYHPQQKDIFLPPTLIVHGKYDPVVPVQAAQTARDELAAIGLTIEYHELEMGHEISPSELDLSKKFITTQMNN